MPVAQDKAMTCFTLEKDIISLIDNAAKKNHRSRSSQIRMIVYDWRDAQDAQDAQDAKDGL